MVEFKNLEEYKTLVSKLEENELYSKSKCVYKIFQYVSIKDPETEKSLEGQYVRKEDANGLLEGQTGFDPLSMKIVIFNFKDGYLHSEDDEPAVQCPGYWEYWNKGEIVKVVSDFGDTEEYWKDGVPVRIETNLAERRKNGELI